MDNNYDILRNISKKYKDEKDYSIAANNYKYNRTNNCLSYNDSLVKITKHNKYINACYVLDKKYILTQAPMIHTINDFWAMIIQNNVETIVQVNQLHETNIVDYFISSKYDIDFEEETINNIRIRYCTVFDGNNEYRVRHIFYSEWIDDTAPDENMIENLLEIIERSNYPIVMHCWAGLGRSATLIATHYLTNYVRDISDFEIFNVVKRLRESRLRAVNRVQYYFIHDYFRV